MSIDTFYFSYVDANKYENDSACSPQGLDHRKIHLFKDEIVLTGINPFSNEVIYQTPGNHKFVIRKKIDSYSDLKPEFKVNIHRFTPLAEDTFLIANINGVAILTKDKMLWSKRYSQLIGPGHYLIDETTMETYNSICKKGLLMSFAGEYERQNKRHDFDYSTLGFLDYKAKKFYKIPFSHPNFNSQSKGMKISQLTHHTINDTVFIVYGQDSTVYRINPDFSITELQFGHFSGQVKNTKYSPDLTEKVSFTFGSRMYSDVFELNSNKLIAARYYPLELSKTDFNNYKVQYEVVLDVFDLKHKHIESIPLNMKGLLFPVYKIKQSLIIPITSPEVGTGYYYLRMILS